MTNKRRLGRYPALAERGVPYTRVHLRRLELAGKFPRRIRLSENVVCWDLDGVEAYIEARFAERDASNSEAA
jgi:prophage regulatory protein